VNRIGGKNCRRCWHWKKDGTTGYGIVSGTAIKVFSDGKIEALGGAIHQYTKHNGKVERIGIFYRQGSSINVLTLHWVFL